MLAYCPRGDVEPRPETGQAEEGIPSFSLNTEGAVAMKAMVVPEPAPIESLSAAI